MSELVATRIREHAERLHLANLTSNLDQPSGDQRAEHRADEEAISQAGRQGAGQAE